MNPLVKFIHAADLHLDSPFKSRTKMPNSVLEVLMESTYNSVTRMIDFAIRESVDFIVLSGDIFDQSNRSLKSEIFLKQAFNRLREKNIFVYMIHGNHDPISSGFKTHWPENVAVFKENVETYEMMSRQGERIYLHGFSYLMDESYENKLDEYPTNTDNRGIHIGLLHGTYAKSKESVKRYTEFNLEALNSKLYHYWALGHIHVRNQLSDLPQIHYAGNMQGRHKNETGEKGFLLVQGDDVSLTTDFIATQEVIFENLTLQTETLRKESLYQHIVEFKEKLREDSKYIINLTIDYDGEDEISLTDFNELIELLQEDEVNVKQFVWIDNIKVSYNNKEQIALLNDIKKSYSNNDDLFREAVNTMYMDPNINRYLPSIGEISQQEMLEMGEERLKMLMRK
ncbi:metallophosphoesterase family protein [Jeotgalicoccus meleagridis]|uniref:metallophosphoesterase family protein n=1 Tax=Jeotgalicoccus meleagridis TaxID=2759181 RepID=UPI001F23599D|nr:DNA repair exonuclease [Jeotgalicoccus meleagridis]